MIKSLMMCFLFGLVQITHAQTTAELLGYNSNAKILIINGDDFGMCHAENVATMDLLLTEGITSATIMVPCPWFKEAAEFCKDNPELDVGIHLTLTSEWERYKWGSVASSNLVPSLLTHEGYFPENTLYVELWAKPDEVAIELRAQIEKAIQFGIIPTHIDNHMATVYGLFSGRDFLDVVFKLSAEYGLPFRLPRNLTAPYNEMLPAERIEKLITLTDSLVAQGFVLPDYLLTVDHGDSYAESFSAYSQILTNLKPGVTELYIHAAVESDEIKAITNSWRNRDFDYRIFKSPEMRELIDSLDIHVIGWRELQQLQIEQRGTAISFREMFVAPCEFKLEQNYPNPFNSMTKIQYTLPQETIVTLKIYNVVGEEVKTLVNQKQSAGYQFVLWDGTDDNGDGVSSGLYFYRIRAYDYNKMGSMMFLK